MRGGLNIGTVREVDVNSGLPATTSTERLVLFDDTEHILGIKIVGGDHRLKDRIREIGYLELDVMEKVLDDFRNKNRHAFYHVGAWKIVKYHEKWPKIPLLAEDSGSSSGKRRKSSESDNYYEGASDDFFTTGTLIPDLNEEVVATQRDRKEKKPVGSSSKSELGSKLNECTSRKEVTLKELVDAKNSKWKILER